MFRSKKIISAIISGVLATQIIMSSMSGAFGYVKAEAANEVTKVSNIIADVNGDGSRNSIDFANMRMKLLGMIDDFPVVNATWASDLDGNGVFNSIDFAYMRQFLLGFRDSFPAEEIIVTPTSSINTPLSTETVTPTSTPVVTLINDTEAPSAPTGLVSTNVTDTSAVLSWSPSTDNVGVEEYGIVSDGMFLLATSKETTIKLSNLEANRTYELWVVASDKQGNVSETSNIYSITTTVSNMEQLKLGLIKNFKTKGTKYSFTYTGDISDIDDNLSNIIYDAVNESSVPFILEDTLYSSSGSYGDFKITLDFTYEDKEYSDVARSVDKLNSVLRTKLNKRNKNINIVYKGSISEAEIDSSINTILNEDSYLEQSISNYSYSMGIGMGITSISIEVEYETSLEQENFVDDNVKLIIDGLVNKDMSDHEKVKLIHDYILSRVVYSEEPEYNSAYEALYYGKTVCEGYAQLTYKLLEVADIENKIVTNEDHAWNLVKLDNKWYHMDTTWDDGETKNDGFYKYYNMTDSELLETRNYINTTGITATSNYISDLTILNNNSNGKYKKILDDIQKNEGYVVINTFKSNSTLDLEYTDIVLKAGEEISLISDKYPQGFFDEAYAWRSSDENIVEVNNGIITAKSEGRVTIAAIQKYNSLMDNNLFAVVTVVPNQSEGKTPQLLSENNFEGFTETGVTPSVTINSGESINNKSIVTNAKSLLEGKVGFIGEPIEVSTTADFDWADISFALSEEQLNGIDIKDLTIYWYDVESNAIVPQVTKIDEASRRLTTTVTHFSPYFIGMKDYAPIDIAFVIDNYYGDSNSINVFQSNIARTIIELRKHTDVRASFIFRDNNKEVDVWDRTFKKVENPTDIDDDGVWYMLYNIFTYIKAFDNELTNQDDIIKICSEASTKGYEILTSKKHFPTLTRETKKYVLVYTQHNGYFIESNSIYLAMPKAYGIVIGNTKGYYQDAAFAYNIDNVIPLASFLIEPVYSQLTLTKTGKYAWVLKEGNANVAEDVIVLQKALVSKGYLIMPLDENGKMVPFGYYGSITKNAVFDFQDKHNDLLSDGIVGKNTWRKLGLPYDYLTGEPDRTSYEYKNILDREYKIELLPSLTLASRYNGDKFEVGDIVEIIAVGRNCDHIALVVNGKWVVTQNGNRFSYNYVVEQAGEIEIYVAARNVPGLKGGTYIETEPVKFEGIEIPRNRSRLYPNGGVSGDVIMFDQNTGIPIERDSLKIYKGGKVFASLQSFLAVYEGQYRVVRRTAYNVKYEFNNGDVLEYDVYETKNEEKAKKPIKITYANGYVEYPDFESERDIFDIWLLMLDVQVLARLVGCEDSVCFIESAGNNVTCFVGGPAVQELIDQSTMSSMSINFLQGMWSGAVDSGKGTVQLVTDFPEVVESMVDLSKDIAIAIKDPNSTQREEYREIIDVIILQAQLAKDDDAAKMIGYITGGVLFEIALAKGAGIAAKNLKTLVKTEIFLDALNKSRIGSMSVNQVIKIAKAINKITSAANDFLNDVAGKIVKLRDGIAVKLALSVIDDPTEAYALIKNSQLSDISKIESIAKEAGRYLEIDEIAPDIAHSVKNVRKNGDVLELLDGDGNVLRTMSETVADRLEEVANYINKIKVDFGDLHLNQLAENDLISGIAQIQDDAIRTSVMKKIRSYEGALKYDNVTIKIKADALEAEVAAAVSNRTNITEFAKNIDTELGRVGEIDVGTNKHIIEVTIGDSSKSAMEFLDYMKTPINPGNAREVILYAPNMTSIGNITNIESVGVKIIKNIDELMNYVGG